MDNLNDQDKVVRRWNKTVADFGVACNRLAASMKLMQDAFENFAYACYEWPDEVIEDVLDAEFIQAD